MIAPTNFLTCGGSDLDSIHKTSDRPMDAARKIHQLITVEGETWKRVMQMFSRSVAWIYTHKKLLDLHPDVQKMIPVQTESKGRPRTALTTRAYLGYCFAAPLSALPLERQKEAADYICSNAQLFKMPKDVADYVSRLMKENSWKKKKSELTSWSRKPSTPKKVAEVAETVSTTSIANTSGNEDDEVVPAGSSPQQIRQRFIFLIDLLDEMVRGFEDALVDPEKTSLHNVLQGLSPGPRKNLRAQMRRISPVLHYGGQEQ